MGGTVADGVNNDAHTQFGSDAHCFLHFLFGQYEYSPVARVAFKTIKHCCGLRAKRAIGEDFDAAKVQHVITKSRTQSQVSKLGQHVAWENHVDTHTQRSLLAQLLEKVQRIALLDIVNRGKASLLQLFQFALYKVAGKHWIALVNDVIDEGGCSFLLQNTCR